MRAVVVGGFGGPDVLDVVEVPVPVPAAGQLRIRVAAAGVNPVDVVTRDGTLAAAGITPRRFPMGLGWDVAGVVDAVGSGVAGFAPGDAVIGVADRAGAPLGAYAEYVVLDAGAVAAAPASVSFAEAATLPLNGLTAAQALDLAEIRAGRLLVTGAGGAVGGFAAELAAGRGIEVVAVAGAGDEGFLRDVGVEHVIPRGADVGEAVRAVIPGGVDGVVDAALLGIEALDAVRNGGVFVAVTGAVPPGLRNIAVRTVWIHADAARLASLARLVDDGRLTPRVADTYPLEAAADAHRRLAAGGLRGRLVLTT